MHNLPPRPVRTGSDPRSLPDFAALRDEMAKLTHPARPDVNWQRAGALALLLFEHNGVELQTGAWYTLARTHLARVNGMNEGLAVLAALLRYQWVQLWPQQIHARAEILSGLFLRLQNLLRTFSFSHSDLPSLGQAEKELEALSDILAKQSLKHACPTAPLLQLVRSAVTRLENSSEHDEAAAVLLPPQALASVPAAEQVSSVNRLVYVIRQQPEVNVDVIHETQPAAKRWPVFLAGILLAWGVGGLAFWGWQYVQRVDAASQSLNASVAALPRVLNDEQIRAFRQTKEATADQAEWLKRAASQLDVLAALSPAWSVQYGQALLEQAQKLWPESDEVMALQKQWQQQQAANALAASSLTGWHDGMQQLQQLSDKLNALDGQKGKYITVSELKSSVYQMMNDFRRTIPLEEQLRMLDNRRPDNAAMQQEAQRHLNGLLHLYNQQTAGK